MKSSKKLRRATKGNNGHWSWKNQNGQEKAKTSNEKHKKSKWKPGYIKNKKEQRRAAKCNERQMETRTKNQNEQQKATKSIFIPIFIHSQQFETYGRWFVSRAMKSQKEQRRATKSNEKQQKATKSNKKQQRTSELEKPKRARQATKGSKSPNRNQASASPLLFAENDCETNFVNTKDLCDIYIIST